MIINGLNKSFKERFQNRVNLANDYFILIMTSLLVWFTDYAYDAKYQYYVGGFSYITIMIVVILFNTWVILQPLIRMIKLYFMKCFNRLWPHIEFLIPKRLKGDSEKTPESKRMEVAKKTYKNIYEMARNLKKKREQIEEVKIRGKG